MSATKLVTFHVPTELLESLGRLVVAHSHLDYILRMTIKSLTGVAFEVALEKTRRVQSSALRKRIMKLARGRLGEEDAERLEEIIERCWTATDERNDFVHAIWGREFEWGRESEAELLMNSGAEWRRLPPAADLDSLAERIDKLRDELNGARLHGWLAFALATPPRSDT